MLGRNAKLRRRAFHDQLFPGDLELSASAQA